MKKFASALLTSAAIVFAASAAQAMPQVLDTFETPDGGVTLVADTVAATIGDAMSEEATVGQSTPAPGVQRLVTSVRTSDSGVFETLLNDGNDGLFQVATSGFGEGVSWISYELDSSVLSSEAINAFVIDVAFVDEGADIGVAVNDMPPMALELDNVGTEGNFLEVDSGLFFVPLSSFVDGVDGNWVTLFIDTRGQAAADVGIESFATGCVIDNQIVSRDVCQPTEVAEPGTLGLIGLGLIGLGAAVRRRR